MAIFAAVACDVVKSHTRFICLFCSSEISLASKPYDMHPQGGADGCYTPTKPNARSDQVISGVPATLMAVSVPAKPLLVVRSITR